MDACSLKYIAAAAGGEIARGSGETEVRRVCTDSREAREGDLFVPLSGERHDGHQFIGQAAARGAVAALVERDKQAAADNTSLAVVAVEETRQALGRLAARYRSEWAGTAIAVCGSNGKTTTKDLIASVLRQERMVCASPASYNNDVGVPLTLLALGREHDVAVVEAGTNHPGELAPLIRMIAPRFGVLTCIAREHLEFFGDLAGVAAEESALAEGLPGNGKLFAGGDSPELDRIREASRAPVVTIGTTSGNDWQVKVIEMNDAGVRFDLRSPDPVMDGIYTVNLIGLHQAANAAFAIAVGKELGLGRAAIQRGLSECAAPNMRLQLREQNGVRVLDDSYNANVESVRAALETLSALPCEGRRIAVLGDLAEQGPHTEAAMREVGEWAAHFQVDELVAVGKWAETMLKAAAKKGLCGRSFQDAESAGRELRGWVRRGDCVLVKASRAGGLERVSAILSGRE